MRPSGAQSRRPLSAASTTRSGSEPAPLYARVLGAAAAKLDTHVTALYVNARCVRAHGRMDVHRGASMAARLCCALMRLPTAGRDIPVTLAIGRHGNAERWWRRFGDDRPLVTSQHLAADGALVKRYGVIELRFVVSSCRAGLQWHSITTRVRIGPVAVRLPAPLQPTVHAVALPTDDAGIWVRVRITAPVIGRLLTYHGTIEQEKDHAYRALAARRTRRGRRLRHPLVP